uniref:Leucine-rich repeat-containing protein 59 n=1 Tax=Lepisosteus oculatus TaxID=7918 RepID=W5MZB8_LEPOC
MARVEGPKAKLGWTVSEGPSRSRRCCSCTMSKIINKGVNLRDKINGNEMDLSLCNLTEVPVKELSAFPKATALDLSCNNLTILPSDFCGLTHLTKLDLSKNQLSQLPAELGRLISLQHLDLYNNKLTMLPVSFAQLKNLKWLDLKDNPLEPSLAKAAGDCLDEKQCKQCAGRVLQYMRVIQEQEDKEKERRLQREKASELEKKREAQQRAKEAREREARKREKAEEKERKRREYDAQRAAMASQEKPKKKEQVDGEAKGNHTVVKKSAPRPRRSVISLLLKLLLFLLVGVLAVVGVCQMTELRQEATCVSINVMYEEAVSQVRGQEVVRRILQKLSVQQP